MLGAALAYARMRWRIFPLHGIVNGRCTCGKPHPDGKGAGKHPRTKQGFKEATNDPEQIRKWFTRWPDANIGIATGSGLVVIDIDGAAGAAEFKALVAAHGPPPATLIAQTGNGAHAFYLARADSPEIRSSARGSVHVRGEGGYVVAAPSRHASGRTYRWVRKNPLAILPDWLRQWSQGYEISETRGQPSTQALQALGQIPTYLQNSQSTQPDVAKNLEEALRTVHSPSEEARLASALQAIPVKSCSYEDFYKIGMALKELDWERSDGTDIAFGLWDAWCSQSEHYNPAGLEFKWKSFGRRSGITLGTVYHLAHQHGWNGGLPSPQGYGATSPLRQGASAARPDPPARPLGADTPAGLNGHALNGADGSHALPAAFVAASQAIVWPDVNEHGAPKSTCANTTVAVMQLGISCRKDLFHEKFLVDGEPINAWAGEMSDDVVQMIRRTVRYRFGFDPKAENTRDACTHLCLDNQFNPVQDYLASLRWDGVPRIETWLTRYMNAPDTELNRVIGRITLVAAARRARYPGTKFDQIIVFESREGKGKSTAIEILAGSGCFSDQHILGVPSREQQEAMSGVWLYEIADMTGMKKTDIEQVKAFASRKVDRARPAYGRYRVDRPRVTILFATTNDSEYLKSQTGNRRFWPVVTGHVDLDGLRLDRDQIWAEAAACEARGDSIGLPERLWAAASSEQEKRMETDSWQDCIVNYLAQTGKTDTTTHEVLVDNQFMRMEPSRIGRTEQMRAGNVLRQLGFEPYKKWCGTHTQNRYRKEEKAR
jgi:Virulence-associated protein E-like domain/Bifunctional DNA primase/polymerase, N-terminal/Primase C terminal 2 (PriCT-2)